MRRATLAATLMLLICGPALAHSRRRPPLRSAPHAAFQVRLGAFMPDGDSGFWNETEQIFTLDAEDLDGFMLGFTYLRPIGDQAELGVNIDFFEERERSAVRGFVDSFGLPILHDTELSVVPITVDVRLVPGGRYRMRPGGRAIPRPLFYVGGGVGLNFWQYDEFGDFVDMVGPPAVIFGDFEDDGVALEAHALAGVEIPVGRRTNFLFEARYSVSGDDLGGDFQDIPGSRKIDLGGKSFFGGVSFRF